MEKKGVWLLALVALTGMLASATILTPSDDGANSDTYVGNFNNITLDFLNQTLWNTTQTFTESTLNLPVYWVPWMDSSSACGESNLKEDYVSGTANWTHNEMVTDEFSEVGIILSRSEEEDSFYQWYTLLSELESQTYDGLPCWVATRQGNDVTCASNDTASDGTARIALALYYATTNSRFTNQTSKDTYKAKADAMAQKHVEHEIYYDCKTSHISGDQLCYWPMGGGDAAVDVEEGGGADLWVGYFPDLVDFMFAAYTSTGNSTYLDVAEDYVDAYLIASLTNYTGVQTTRQFGMAPKNFKWSLSSSPITIYAAPGESYHFTIGNGAWDDSDAPRAIAICNNLRNAEFIYGTQASFPTSYNNLSTYCTAWSLADDAYTSTSSYIQYYYNGTGYSTLTDGWYENGLGIYTHAWNRTDEFQTKLDQLLTKYQFNQQKPDYATNCFGVYRGVRGIKALGLGIGEYDNTYDTGKRPISGTTNTITIQVSEPLNGTAATTEDENVTIGVIVTNYNITQITNTTTDPTPKLYSNYTFQTQSDLDAWGGATSESTGAGGYLEVESYATAYVETGYSLNLSDYSSYNLSIDTYTNYTNYGKFYFMSEQDSTTGPRWFWERAGDNEHIVLKYEGGSYSTISNVPINQNWTVEIVVNGADNETTAYLYNLSDGTLFGTAGPESFTNSKDDYIRIEGGDTQGDNLIYAIRVTNTGNNVSYESTTAGDSTINVSFYNASDNALIGNATGVASGSTTTVNWTIPTTIGLTYNWYVIAESQNNLVVSSNHSFTYGTDSTAPSITINSPTSGEVIHVGDPTIYNFTVTDTESGVDTIFYSINGGSNVTYTSPVTLSQSINTYTVVVWANDSAGNEASSVFTYTVEQDTSSGAGGGSGGEESVLSNIVILGYQEWYLGEEYAIRVEAMDDKNNLTSLDSLTFEIVEGAVEDNGQINPELGIYEHNFTVTNDRVTSVRFNVTAVKGDKTLNEAFAVTIRESSLPDWSAEKGVLAVVRDFIAEHIIVFLLSLGGIFLIGIMAVAFWGRD